MEKNFENIYQMLEYAANTYQNTAAYFERKNNEWQKTDWLQLKEMADHFALALLTHEFTKGNTVSILAGNCMAWPVSDLGTVAAGGIAIGIYPSSSPEQCAYILNHSGSRFVVTDSSIQLAKILQIQEQVPTLRKIIAKEIAAEQKSDKIIGWDDFLASGNFPREKMEEIAHSGKIDETAIIVYTSGTTGNPKGACLSNRYVLASCRALDKVLAETRNSIEEKKLPKEGENFCMLSFLPFCHVAERISGMYARIYSGFAAYFIDDITKLYPYMLEINPHMFGGVPRFFEKIYAKIMNEVEQGKGYDKHSFHRAIEVNKQVKQCQKEGQTVPEQLQQEYDKAEKQVYDKVRANFGKRIITCSSGAAPIPQEVLDMFEYAGNLHILEVYGLTEFVCCAFNTPTAHKANTVGKPMHGCEVKIAEDGEILLRGPQMFSGYYKDEQATAEVIDEQGWLHTGDIGKLDEEGFLSITGRKKEFIKTSTGKKIAPLYIENLCKRNHLMSNVMVYGDNKKYLTALVTLNPLELKTYAKVHDVSFKDYSELIEHPQIIEIVAKAINEVNEKVSRTEQIKKYKILPRDFLVEEDEITPTGKVKRRIVCEKFKDVIESLYE